jgi:hypothetical protein
VEPGDRAHCLAQLGSEAEFRRGHGSRRTNLKLDALPVRVSRLRLGRPEPKTEAYHRRMAKVDGRKRALPLPLLILLLTVWALQLAMLVPLPVTVAVTVAALAVYVARRRANSLR